jgi:hypothetical protein
MARPGSLLLSIACALLLAPSLCSAADARPDELKDDSVGVTPTMTRDLVRELRLGSHTLRFEESKLSEIRGLIGAGELRHAGDAADSIDWLCYSLPGQLVWFISTEMGGGELLMRVVAREASESDPRRKVCPPIPSSLQPVALEFGWIGTSEPALRAALSDPSATYSDRRSYLYSGKEAGLHQGKPVDFDVMAFIEVELAKGRVVSLEASHVTSYRYDWRTVEKSK